MFATLESSVLKRGVSVLAAVGFVLLVAGCAEVEKDVGQCEEGVAEISETGSLIPSC